MRYQIRTRGHGLCLVEALTALDALEAFARSRGADEGEVTFVSPSAVSWRGNLYEAVAQSVPEPVTA